MTRSVITVFSFTLADLNGRCVDMTCAPHHIYTRSGDVIHMCTHVYSSNGDVLLSYSCQFLAGLFFSLFYLLLTQSSDGHQPGRLQETMRLPWSILSRLWRWDDCRIRALGQYCRILNLNCWWNGSVTWWLDRLLESKISAFRWTCIQLRHNC